MVETITKEELKKKIERNENFILLDVRDTPDYEKEHITGALHLLISDMDKKADTILEKDEQIITYSEDYKCPASTFAAEKLKKMGYRDVLDYKGSYKEWYEAGYPTTS